MATATGCLSFCSSSLFPNDAFKFTSSVPKRFTSSSLTFLINSNYLKLSSLSATVTNPSLRWPSKEARFPAALAVVDEEAFTVDDDEIADEDNVDGNEDEEGEGSVKGFRKRARPCELYVCNLPRSHDIPELLEMFKPFGTVISVEVSRNPATGVSRGCGYVTMGSINSAKNAIIALDGSDVSGREMRVKFSVDMNPGQRNPEALNSTPKRIFIYESPHKLYVGNLPWSTKPDDLRNHFKRFGTVVSVRLLHDRRGGKNRIFGFLSFTSASERDAAISLNGTDFRGRTLIVRHGVERTEPAPQI